MNENLIGINIANGVSILIMGAVGALILTALRKMARRKAGATNAPMANFVS